MCDIFIILCFLQHFSWENFPLECFWLLVIWYVSFNLKFSSIFEGKYHFGYIFSHIFWVSVCSSKIRGIHGSPCLLEIQDPLFEIQI